MIHRGASGSDEKISASKIQPLDSETKHDQPHDQSSRGAAGSDRNIDQARIDPLGEQDQSHGTALQGDEQGVVGSDKTIGEAKIEPLEGKENQS